MARSPTRSVHSDTEPPEDTPLLAGETPLLADTPTTPTTPTSTTRYAFSTTTTDYGDDNDNDADDNDPSTRLRALLRPRVILLSMVLIFLVELSIGISVPAINAVMESIICRQMHPAVFLPAPPLVPPPSTDAMAVTMAMAGGNFTRHLARGIVLTDDPRCKEADVQGYLAMLRGWMATFDCVPGIVGAVPYGILSDRWGRRPVLGLSFVGVVASVGFTYLVFYFSEVVPLWVTWFSAVFQLVGGGAAILVAMLYTAIADVVVLEERATVFFQLTAVFLATQLVAGLLGGAMLIWNPWFPLLASLVVLVIATVTVLAFPETVHVHGVKEVQEEEQADLNGTPEMRKLWRKAVASLVDVWDFVLSNRSVATLMLSLTFVVLGRYVGELLLQYSTARYHWSWTRAQMVLTIRNVGSLATLLAILPAATRYCMQRLGMSGTAKDLWLARWSGVLQIVGSLIIAAAVNGGLYSFGLVWYALGAGMAAVVRSLINTLVEEHHVGTVNSLIGFMEMVGLTAAGPLLAKSLGVGLSLGGAWVGLPFIAAGLFFVVSTTILWTIRLPNGLRLAESSC